eukprot:Sdes_comp20977_c0_seq41m19217
MPKLGVLSTIVRKEHIEQSFLDKYNLQLVGCAENYQDGKCILAVCDICIADPTIFKELVNFIDKNCPLQWVQFTFAGVEKIVHALRNLPAIPYKITRCKGSFGQQIAEYSLTHVCYYERNFAKLRQLQAEKVWSKQVGRDFSPLSERTLGILGIGNIGKQIARLASCGYHMKVIGFLNDSSNYKGLSSSELQNLIFCHQIFAGPHELPEFLSQVDYLIAILPATPATDSLLDGDILENCRQRRPLFVNVGRGNIISNSTL